MNIDKHRQCVKTYNALSKLPLGSVQARGWLRDQLLRIKNGMGGHLDELEPDMIARPFVDKGQMNVANSTLSPSIIPGWSSEISGTYWSGLVQLAYTLGDIELISKAENWVNAVLANVEEDGYIGSYRKEDNRDEDYNAWGTNWGMRAVLSYFEATGRQDVLSAVHRGMLWFCDNWAKHKTDYVGATIIESMITVYSVTGDERLVRFCEDYIAWLGEYSQWPNDLKSLLSDDLHYNSMHVVAYGEDAKHPAILYCATGKEELLQASIKGLDKALAKITQRTGAPVSNYEYIGPVSAISSTEYCNFATYNHSYSWMSNITGEARWGDYMEKIVYNGAQGARKKDERAIAYMSAPNQIKISSDSGLNNGPDSDVYAPCYYVACCPAQSVRIIPEYVRGMVLCDREDNLYFTAYGPCSIDNSGMKLEMDTLYPFRDTLTLRILECAAERTIHFKIPCWCQDAHVAVNGQSVDESCVPGQYLPLCRQWKSGDIIELIFPMKPFIIRVDDSDGAAKYPLAIEYGPLLFALPIPEVWSAYHGRPLTTLPEGWNWFTVQPKLKNVNDEQPHSRSNQYERIPYNMALRESLTSEEIEVVPCDTAGYAWESPYVRLRVPAYKATYAFTPHARMNTEVTEAPVAVTGEEHKIELVPFGCTNLRIAYFPRAKV